MGSELRVAATHAVRVHTRTYETVHREALERDHWGRAALMRGGEVVEIFDQDIDAYDAGVDRFGNRNFAVMAIGVISTGYRVVGPVG